MDRGAEDRLSSARAVPPARASPRGSAMALEIEDHVFAVVENQWRLYEYLGEHRWDFNMDEGVLVFSSAESGGLLGRFLGGKPEVRAKCPVQLIGSESKSDGTWLWAWANERSQIPPPLRQGVERVRDDARAENRPVFVDANPIPLPHPHFGTELAIICTGHLGLFTYYACGHGGGALYVAIAEAPEGARQERTALQAISCMEMGIGALEFNHRRAVLAYLGEPSAQEGDAMEWQVGAERVRVRFDAQDRIAKMAAQLEKRT
jgi:hypothetical protein